MQARRRLARRRGLLTAAFSGAAHAALILALFSVRPATTPAVDVQPITVQLVEPPPPAPPPPKPETPAAAKPAPPKVAKPTKPKKIEKPPPRRIVARRAPTHRDVVPVQAIVGPTAAEGASEVSDAELASAATADSGSGSGGGSCNITRRLQNALRKDPLVQAAMAEAHTGKAIRVWNGDWIRHGAQEGNGLAAVREAIMWEVAFAPEACRKQPVHGLVQISLNDSPGAPRLVVGSGEWRWSDVLFSGSRRR